MPVYIEKNGDLVGCHHSGTTNERTNDEQGKIELLSQQWTMALQKVRVVPSGDSNTGHQIKTSKKYENEFLIS